MAVDYGLILRDMSIVHLKIQHPGFVKGLCEPNIVATFQARIQYFHLLVPKCWDREANEGFTAALFHDTNSPSVSSLGMPAPHQACHRDHPQQCTSSYLRRFDLLQVVPVVCHLM